VDERLLYVRTVEGVLCRRCYVNLGQPRGKERPDVEIHEIEEETRTRMQKRKGADAYRVRAGKT
jgi:hypothetical protein